LYLYGYSISRFFLEYLRYDTSERGIFGTFSTSQWISIGILLLISGWGTKELGRKKKKSKKLS
jgi:Prolipoprotein diacylglyceryltransferase